MGILASYETCSVMMSSILEGRNFFPAVFLGQDIKSGVFIKKSDDAERNEGKTMFVRFKFLLSKTQEIEQRSVLWINFWFDSWQKI